MEFGWSNNLAGFIISLVIFLAVYGILTFTYVRVVKRRFPYISLAISFVFILVSLIFNSIGGLIICSFVTSIIIGVTLNANIGDLRSFLAAPFKKKTAKNGKFGVEKIFDRDALYNEIEKAVLSLSKTRTGALITLEKNTTLSDLVKNGIPLKAPVKCELLETIFYPGTRLHDGAVVIHGNEILAAAVFYTPTTKPFAVKYGSRHRAAIGISEVSDAVTIIVSEETGRISFAVNGELNVINPENFRSALEVVMDSSSDDEE